jgi:hypothetical protein
MTKEKRPAAKLEEMLLTEIRKHPELNVILDVAVTPHRSPVSDGPTWEASYVTDGPDSKVALADEIARLLQGQFDLA